MRHGRPLPLVRRVIALLTLLATTPVEASLYEQRATYKAALDHLTAGRASAYRSARQTLQDYVLLPYLDYYELQSRLSSASAGQIQRFRETHGMLPVADIVFWRWLKRLGSRREWRTFLDNYEPATDAAVRCYRLRALNATGARDAAFAEAEPLWLVGSSQPKACDPLFEAWIAAGHLTESLVWARLELAIDANARTLARYLQRFLEPATRTLAQSYLSVHVTPSGITRTNRFRGDDPRTRTVIRHGLERLATRDPGAAQSAWADYSKSHSFSDDDRAAISGALALGFAEEGEFPDADAVLPVDAIERIAAAAVAGERWAEAAVWIDRMDPETRAERRWQYWLARALDGSVLGSQRAQRTYQALAEARDYYGFLAAEQIGRQVQLNHATLENNPIKINQLQRIPAVQRAVELYAVGDLVNARREWRELLPTLDAEQKAAAAALALSIGWTAQSIRTASDPALRDTLELRFPLAFADSFKRVSYTTTVPQSFLFAVARQESVFDPRARSSANARGLMQMIHPTATRVARRVGLPTPSVSELYDPAVNIELAGHHLAALLDDYDNQRPLAAAAYNAGETRVNRWTRDRSGLAMDVWIETIPFRETRNYVKNVLAFAQVYSQLLDAPAPMLRVHEAALQ